MCESENWWGRKVSERYLVATVVMVIIWPIKTASQTELSLKWAAKQNLDLIYWMLYYNTVTGISY